MNLQNLKGLNIVIYTNASYVNLPNASSSQGGQIPFFTDEKNDSLFAGLKINSSDLKPRFSKVE